MEAAIDKLFEGKNVTILCSGADTRAGLQGLLLRSTISRCHQGSVHMSSLALLDNHAVDLFRARQLQQKDASVSIHAALSLILSPQIVTEAAVRQPVCSLDHGLELLSSAQVAASSVPSLCADNPGTMHTLLQIHVTTSGAQTPRKSMTATLSLITLTDIPQSALKQALDALYHSSQVVAPEGLSTGVWETVTPVLQQASLIVTLGAQPSAPPDSSAPTDCCSPAQCPHARELQGVKARYQQAVSRLESQAALIHELETDNRSLQAEVVHLRALLEAHHVSHLDHISPRHTPSAKRSLPLGSCGSVTAPVTPSGSLDATNTAHASPFAASDSDAGALHACNTPPWVSRETPVAAHASPLAKLSPSFSRWNEEDLAASGSLVMLEDDVELRDQLRTTKAELAATKRQLDLLTERMELSFVKGSDTVQMELLEGELTLWREEYAASAAQLSATQQECASLSVRLQQKSLALQQIQAHLASGNASAPLKAQPMCDHSTQTTPRGSLNGSPVHTCLPVAKAEPTDAPSTQLLSTRTATGKYLRAGSSDTRLPAALTPGKQQGPKLTKAPLSTGSSGLRTPVATPRAQSAAPGALTTTQSGRRVSVGTDRPWRQSPGPTTPATPALRSTGGVAAYRALGTPTSTGRSPARKVHTAQPVRPADKTLGVSKVQVVSLDLSALLGAAGGPQGKEQHGHVLPAPLASPAGPSTPGAARSHGSQAGSRGLPEKESSQATGEGKGLLARSDSLPPEDDLLVQCAAANDVVDLRGSWDFELSLPPNWLHARDDGDRQDTPRLKSSVA